MNLRLRPAHSVGAALAAIPRLLLMPVFAPRGAPTAAASCLREACRAMLAVALASTLLSGCATRRLIAQDTSQVTSHATAPRTHFSLAGRFSAKTERDQVSGQFRFTQRAGERTLNLFSPLGTPMAEIVAQGTRAVLTQADGTTQSADSMAALLRTVIDLPVTDAMMSAWLQGLPSHAEGVSANGVERDGQGLPTRFVESGWEIEVSARMEGTPVAPKRMRWRVAGQQDIEVRWVIDEWSTP